MALPDAFKRSLTPAEVEFLAEDEPIMIRPQRRMDQLRLITGDYGPLQPPLSREVPLWMAITLKKKRKCAILPPEWASVEFFRERLEQERRDPVAFTPMPPHWMETLQLLLDNARDDLRDADALQSLAEDVHDERQAKIRKGLRSNFNGAAIDITNLGRMEINDMRPFLLAAFSNVSKLDQKAEYFGDDVPMA